MFKKLMSTLGLGVRPDASDAPKPVTPSARAAPAHAPYAAAGMNTIYNLLFCDEAAAFAPKPGEAPASWQAALFADVPDAAALERLAADPAQEGRIRFLACTRLRALGRQVPPKLLLAVIVEVPLSGGLDTLAAFAEGGVRYINQSGKLAVLEGVPAVLPLVQGVFDAARTIVDRIGPWDKPRLAPPVAGNIRMTFLVSDGPYFGEGPMNAMRVDSMAGPLIQRATALLQAVVNLGTA